jgi:hypothetical protein
MIYDIIGDIHGQADKLEGLLLKLEYEMQEGIYQHKERIAVFVGDFIDRGRQNRRVIEIVRSMVDYGHACAVMGNHEYNAICYHTTKSETDWLRSHTKSNFHQHENFLKEYPQGQDDTNEVIDWFKTLPLYLEFEHFCVIHGCWDQAMIDQLKSWLDENNRVAKEGFFEDSANKQTQIFHIVERVLKGVEVKLPHRLSFKDKDGKERHHIRVKWWGEPGASFRKLAFGYDDDVTNSFPDDQAPDSSSIPFYSGDNRPVFFGHYWMTGEPQLQKDNICCVDYSAGTGGELVCYSFFDSNEVGLNVENFTISEG